MFGNVGFSRVQFQNLAGIIVFICCILPTQETEPHEDFIIPGVPQFTYQDCPKMEFPLLVKKVQGRTDRDERHEEEDASSSSSNDGGFSTDATVKAASTAQDTQNEARYDDVR